MNYLSNVKDLGDAARQNCSVDTPIHFLKYSSPTVSDSSKIYAKGPIDPKYAPNRHGLLNPPQVCYLIYFTISIIHIISIKINLSIMFVSGVPE